MADDSATTVAARPLRRRLIALGLLLVTVGAGLAVHLLAPDGAASDIAGDALYAVAVYLAVVILLPRVRVAVAGLIAAAWCVAVEVFQVTGVPLDLGRAFPPAVLVLGTVFDVRDVVVYLVTIAVVALADGVLRGGRRSRA
ncbi:DUF2809 domain-containing protein [Microbacterium sp.]|jgi:hypothetical protein|uniref:DUF2809 domain-containing protein n=1 Tax=Microbacterium sp. TaxID=51671 RepID=UPI0037CB2AA4